MKFDLWILVVVEVGVRLSIGRDKVELDSEDIIGWWAKTYGRSVLSGGGAGRGENLPNQIHAVG